MTSIECIDEAGDAVRTGPETLLFLLAVVACLAAVGVVGLIAYQIGGRR